MNSLWTNSLRCSFAQSGHGERLLGQLARRDIPIYLVLVVIREQNFTITTCVCVCDRIVDLSEPSYGKASLPYFFFFWGIITGHMHETVLETICAAPELHQSMD